MQLLYTAVYCCHIYQAYIMIHFAVEIDLNYTACVTFKSESMHPHPAMKHLQHLGILMHPGDTIMN